MSNVTQQSPQLSPATLNGPQEATRRQAANPGGNGAIAHYQCLIVSVSPERREMLLRAAAEGGWQTLVAPDAGTARQQIARLLVQLAIVDLEHAPAEESIEFKAILEDLAGMTGLLLVVCGNEGEPLEEIWARQLGVWLYLPGVTSGDDVTLLCGEARQITEQLHAARQFHAAHEAVASRHADSN